MQVEIVAAIAALALAAGAWWRSRAQGGFYDADVYGMTPRTHRAYALISIAFAVLFFAAARWQPRGGATIWLYAAFVLFAIFYLTSYLRGAHENDD